ncbi:hypothetical protein AHF37_06618 [Paragonimus kellicotti]|nr:hypothetical protein AHF37_06618 [Paragonimus kellicotti]
MKNYARFTLKPTQQLIRKGQIVPRTLPPSYLCEPQWDLFSYPPASKQLLQKSARRQLSKQSSQTSNVNKSFTSGVTKQAIKDTNPDGTGYIHERVNSKASSTKFDLEDSPIWTGDDEQARRYPTKKHPWRKQL